MVVLRSNSGHLDPISGFCVWFFRFSDVLSFLVITHTGSPLLYDRCRAPRFLSLSETFLKVHFAPFDELSSHTALN